MWTLFLATAALAAPTYVVDGTNAARGHACVAGQKVSVNGSNLTVTLTGDCGEVTVTGSRNDIDLDGVSSVVVTGSNNDVTYQRNLSRKKKLPTSFVGVGNTVHK